LKNKVILSVFILLSLCALLVPEVRSENDKSGTSSLSFLKLGVGARAVGMGEAFCAQSDRVSSPFWNPAAVSGIQGSQISLTHTKWFQDITVDYFSSAIRIEENVFGLSLSMGKVPDIEKRGEVATTEPLALFDARDVVLSFSFARNLRERYAIGFSVKWMYEKIDISSGSGLGFDVGGICSPFATTGKTVLQDLTFGASVLNLGSKIKFEKESFNLPTQYKAGVKYFAERKQLQSDFTWSLDLVKSRDDDMKVHLGGEYGLHRTFKLRLGYQFGYDEKSISFGMGIKFKKYSIDYAFLPYKSDLGDVHCVSLDVEF